MKILLINNFHYLRGGSERVYLETSSLLEEKGHKVIHFSTKNKENLPTLYENYFIEDETFMDKPFVGKLKSFWRFFYSIEAKQKLEELIRKEKPEIAHLHIFYGRLTSSILPALKKYNIPTVMTVHEYKMLCPMYLFLDMEGKICEKCAIGKYYNCIIKRCNRKSLIYSTISAFECYFRDIFFPWDKYIDIFIMVSKFLYNKYVEYKPHLKDKSVIIHNFIDIRSYKSKNPQDDFMYYLYFGRLSREKGLITLLEAWRYVPHLKLKIVGTGDLGNFIRNYIKNNKLLNIEFIGFKTGNELKDIIRRAKFTIVPSEWYETFGMTILESFALGVPVIASNIGAIPELVKDSFNGFLFESGNVESLVNCLKKSNVLNENEYTLLSKNARMFAEKNFSKEKYYNKLMDIYLSVFTKKRQFGGNYGSSA